MACRSIESNGGEPSDSGFSEGAELLNSLSDGQILAVTLIDYSSVEHSFTFEVGAISGLRAQIDALCHSSVTAKQTK
jgi:hypothetical protein